MTTAYVDASALVKLVVFEAESVAVQRWYVETEQVLTSRVGIVEAYRSITRRSHDPTQLRVILGSIEIFELDADIAARAMRVSPDVLRTLDAIHVATALAIGPTLDAFVTYDDRQAEAARAAGLPVVRPA